MPTRKEYYAMIHLGAARLGYKDEADYRTWLQSLTGKASCAELTLDELAATVSTLRSCKALEDQRIKSARGGQGATRPTDAQWQAANRLCRRLGMTGCDDAQFHRFAAKIAKVDHPRFLTKESMRRVIAALCDWFENVKAKNN